MPILEAAAKELVNEMTKENYKALKTKTNEVISVLVKRYVEDELLEKSHILLQQIKNHIELLKQFTEEVRDHPGAVVQMQSFCQKSIEDGEGLLGDIHIFHAEQAFDFTIPLTSISWNPDMKPSNVGSFRNVYHAEYTMNQQSKKVAIKSFTDKDKRYRISDFVTEEEISGWSVNIAYTCFS